MAEKLIIAQTAEEAVNAGTKSSIFMAGGTEVMRLGSGVKADCYISVRNVPAMHNVKAAEGLVSIGASCTFQELLDNEQIPEYMKEALLFMASRTRRNMATIGGNIAVSGDDSFLIPTLIASGAQLVLLSKASKTEKITVFEYVSNKEKYKEALIIEIIIPSDGISVKSVRSANTAQSHARLTASLSLKDGRYCAAVALKNSGIYLLDDLAASLSASAMSEEEIVEFVKNKKDIKLEDDLLYGGADYRRYLTGITFAMMYEELKGGRS